jgi:hypothetical protein
MKNPKLTDGSKTNKNTSVYSTISIRIEEAMLPRMHIPTSFLYAKVFLSILSMITLPKIPEITHTALNALVFPDSNPNGAISYPNTTAKSMKHP